MPDLVPIASGTTTGAQVIDSRITNHEPGSATRDPRATISADNRAASVKLRSDGSNDRLHASSFFKIDVSPFQRRRH
jgi:hypothetical protein